MKTNNHSKAMDKKELADAIKQIKGARDKFAPYVTPLSARDRQAFLKMGPKTLEFVTKSHEFAVENAKNPAICPPYLDVEAFSADFADASSLYLAENLAAQLLHDIIDMQTTSGSEAYQSALVLYGAVKTAAANDVPGAKAMYDELRKRFTPRRRKGSADTPSELS